MVLLDDSDIEAIVEHIGDKVQFYDSRGVAANDHAQRAIRHALESYIASPSSKAAERFELVSIAFDNILKSDEMQKVDRPAIGVVTVELADAVLAAMETPETETNDGK